MTQPPNPPSGGSPQQPGGWTPQGDDAARPGWQTDPTQQFSAGQQYPPTRPMPAQGQNPDGWGQAPQAGGRPGYGAGGQYGTAGQYGPPGQYGAPGQYGPPGAGGFGAPPTQPPAPPGAGGGGRNPLPLIIGIVAGVVVLGLVAWWMFLRPAGTATPTPSVATTPAGTASPSAAPPSVLITPTSSPTASGLPSASTGSRSPSAGPSGSAASECSDELTTVQCQWAEYLAKFLVIDSCRPDSSDTARSAFSCRANPRGTLDGTATVTMRWASSNKDLTALMTDFFSRAGVAKSRIGSNWKNPPAHTNWWYNDSPKTVRGKLGSADAKDGTGRVAWTFSKQLFYIEAVSDGDDAEKLLDWWSAD